MSRKCDYCGAATTRPWSLGALVIPMTTIGTVVKTKEGDYLFCGKECAREHSLLRRKNAAARGHNEAIARQQAERENEQEKKQAELEKARSFKVLQQGIDFADWWGDCNACGERLLFPSYSYECQDCGTDCRLELRQYADGYKRLMGCCRVCKTATTLRGLDCRCGGDISASKIKIKPVNSTDDDHHEDGSVIYKSPNSIKPEDVTMEFGKVTGGASHGVTSEKSKWVAFILAVLFGVLGIHRFYAGRKVTGVIWLCSLGFFYVGWAVDVLLILCGKFKDGQGRVLSS